MNSVGSYAVSFISYCIITVYFLASCLAVEALRVNRNEKEDGSRNVTKERTSFDVTRNALKHGYSATEHTVQTEDGYLLTLFRVQRRKGGIKGPPVLLMHGLLQSASMWIDAGPDIALAYLLANAGHDVWLGNDRGTRYSRQHAWLNPDTDSQYWQFSVIEIGSYDLPAVFDYILSQTGAQKLNYIGFSQGGGSFFVMCSEKPEYQSKVNVMLAVAPATRILNTKSIVLNNLFEFYEKNEAKLNSYGVWEVLPHGGFVQSFSQIFCSMSDAASKICNTFITILDAQNPGSKTQSILRTTFGGFPAGTSVRNMARYGQALKATNFQKYDYGPEQNLVHYGRQTPPAFNLSIVKVPTVVIYGKNDGMISVKDIKWLVGKLPNVLEAFEVKDPLWTHMDVCMSRNIPKFLYPKVEEYMFKFS